MENHEMTSPPPGKRPETADGRRGGGSLRRLGRRTQAALTRPLDFAEMMVLSVLSAKDDMRERRLGHCRFKGHRALLILN